MPDPDNPTDGRSQAAADLVKLKRDIDRANDRYRHERTCARCKIEDSRLPTMCFKLAGGFHTRLCDDCLNAWDVAVQAIPEFINHRVAEVEVARAVHDRTVPVGAAVSAAEYARFAMFKIAKVWVEAGVPAPPE